MFEPKEIQADLWLRLGLTAILKDYTAALAKAPRAPYSQREHLLASVLHSIAIGDAKSARAAAETAASTLGQWADQLPDEQRAVMGFKLEAAE